MRDFFSQNGAKAENTGQIGISFSSQRLTLAYISDGEHGKTLTHLCCCEGSVDEQQANLKEQVTTLALQGMHANLILPQKDYQIFLVEQPQVLESEKANALRWLIAEYIDFPVEEAVVDYIELPQKLHSENPSMLYVVVTKKSKIDETYSLINAAGLKVKSIDICQSALRFIAMNLENPEEGQALLHLEEDKSHLIIFKNKTLYMMRDLDLGLNALNSSQSIYQDFSIEVQRSFDYCASKLQNANISRLVITPLEKRQPDFLSNLSNILGLPVREMSFDELISIRGNFSAINDEESVFAIGAALNQDNL